MLIEYLDKAVVPIAGFVIAGCFSVLGIWMSRRGEAPTPPKPAPTLADVPPPAPAPTTTDPVVVQTYLLGEVARLHMASEASATRVVEQDAQIELQAKTLADVGGRLDRLTADYVIVRDVAIVHVRWRDAGAPHPAPMVSDTARRLLGLLHPTTQETP